MKESVVSEKKAGSTSAQRGKKAASLTRDELGVADQPLMSIVQRAGCKDCGPSVRSLAGGIMQTPVAQRQAAAMSLQMARGNRFVQGVAVQAKLMVGPADDEYEREAERVADQVMSMLEPRAQRACPSCEEEEGVQRAPLASRITPLVQREAAPEEEEEIQTKSMPGRIANRIQRAPEEEEQVQREAAPEEEGEIQTDRSVGAIGGPASTELEQSLSQSRGSGSLLAEGVRGRMENAFGVDFGGVRVHSDARADSLNRSIQARAFTRGQDIFLRQGEYHPASSEGQRLLAHELTHVVQQNENNVLHHHLLQANESVQRFMNIVLAGHEITKFELPEMEGNSFINLQLSKLKRQLGEYRNFEMAPSFEMVRYLPEKKQTKKLLEAIDLLVQIRQTALRVKGMCSEVKEYKSIKEDLEDVIRTADDDSNDYKSWLQGAFGEIDSSIKAARNLWVLPTLPTSNQLSIAYNRARRAGILEVIPDHWWSTQGFPGPNAELHVHIDNTIWCKVHVKWYKQKDISLENVDMANFKHPNGSTIPDSKITDPAAMWSLVEEALRYKKSAPPPLSKDTKMHE
jgi:hypothetical protein